MEHIHGEDQKLQPTERLLFLPGHKDTCSGSQERGYEAAADGCYEPSGKGSLGEEEEVEAGTAELQWWFWLIREIWVTKSACFCSSK